MTTSTGKLLAIDPGKSTGWAIFSLSDLKPEHRGICRSVDAFADLLISFKSATSLRAVVAESFRLRSYTNQAGSEMEAPQVIGMLKLFGKQLGVPVHFQQPSILAIAKRWSSEYPMPKNHQNSHDVSAIHHGRYWLINNNYVDIPKVGRLLPGEML